MVLHEMLVVIILHLFTLEKILYPARETFDL